jgi:hypothetical protein
LRRCRAGNRLGSAFYLKVARAARLRAGWLTCLVRQGWAAFICCKHGQAPLSSHEAGPRARLSNADARRAIIDTLPPLPLKRAITAITAISCQWVFGGLRGSVSNNHAVRRGGHNRAEIELRLSMAYDDSPETRAGLLGSPFPSGFEVFVQHAASFATLSSRCWHIV